MKLSEIVTGNDNVTLDPHLALGTLAVLIGLGLEIYSVVYGKPFDLQAYGVGVGALITLMGAGRKLSGDATTVPQQSGAGNSAAGAVGGTQAVAATRQD